MEIQSSSCKHCDKILTFIQIKRGQKFCSRNCKNESQKKKIKLICTGCRKKFFIWPYLQRKTNYCSLKCYRDSTRVKEKRFCKVCKKEFYAKGTLIRKGLGIYCSIKCLHSTYPKRIIKYCQNCKKSLSVQPSKIKLVKFCSKKCKDDFGRDYVDRICKYCLKPFQLPRWEINKGKGTFCSKRCFLSYKGESAIEKKLRYALQREKVKFEQEVKIGIYRADFLIPSLNLIFECDGDYWHKIPKIVERDKRKDVFLTNLGYSIIRFPENTIRELSVDKLQSTIKDYLFKQNETLQPALSLNLN